VRSDGRGQPKEEIQAHVAEAGAVGGSSFQNEKEVNREEYKWFSRKGKQVPYTATEAAYVLCTGDGQGHEPRCFSGRCRKCNMFGHMGDECSQKI
jgi:hypothetical protein